MISSRVPRPPSPKPNRSALQPMAPSPPPATPGPGRKRHPGRLVFQGILSVLHTGIVWHHLPQDWASVRA
ncbi:transposase [Streptomyces erythrochromogenes]|uniref:transposase n=1 Tax=Streptomyces erythrochromogenes TaxID=285574 RepID=UPI00368B827C